MSGVQRTALSGGWSVAFNPSVLFYSYLALQAHHALRVYGKASGASSRACVAGPALANRLDSLGIRPGHCFLLRLSEAILPSRLGVAIRLSQGRGDTPDEI